MARSEPQEIIGLMKSPTEADKALVIKAFDFASQAHAGQKRLSGEDYITHPVAVAKTLAEFGFDGETIAAALLHDTLEEGGLDTATIKKEFGPTILFLVEGVTKLGKLKYHGIERHVESLRKFFVAMAEDIRVIVIRLADRLHNVQTLASLPPEKQKRIAVETLEIYAPLANRLGIWRLKGMLEDAAFPYARPAEFKQVAALRKTKGKETIKKLEKVHRTLSRVLADHGLKKFEIDYRVKYLYSLYQKLKKNNMEIEKIFDISALRVIVPTTEECYRVLGLIHTLWRPVPGRLRDYIANPKPNGYQSLHTAVFTNEGEAVEIQVRSQAMQQEAEFGVASHVAYHESGKPRSGGRLPKSLQWIEELIEWQKQVDEHEEFLHTLKTDFFSDRIFVFTPKGDVIELPAGATPLDLAYAIHSDIGDHAAGAKVNGKMVGLASNLKNGDVVGIETKRSAHPSAKWLEQTKTVLAKRHIRSALQKTRS